MTMTKTTATNQPYSVSLSRLRRQLQAVGSDQDGASFVEYVIVVGLVAIIAIVAFQSFGQAIVTKLGEETNAVTGLQISGGGAPAPATP